MKNGILTLFSLILITVSCNRKPINNNETTTKTINKNTTKSHIIQEPEKEKTANVESLKYSDKGSLNFKKEFIYTYKNGENQGKVSLFYDDVNKLVLYYPEVEMAEFVIIDKNGEVYFFYNGVHGDRTIQRDKLTFTPDNPNKNYPLSKRFATVKPITEKFSIDDRWTSGRSYDLQGYRLNYEQYNDSLDFYITDKIDVNSEQLHAFGQLIDLDWNYPLPLGNLTYIVSSKQLIGKVTTKNLEILLECYCNTNVYARISDYTYYVKDKDDKWVAEKIPLQDFAIK